MADVPHIIRNLQGINRDRNPVLVAENEFETLQNWIHTLDGGLSKRFGTTQNLPTADLTGISRVNGISRFLDQDKKRYNIYHCQPDETFLPDPTTDLTLTPVVDATSLLNPTGVDVEYWVCYTFVGLDVESAWNSHNRGGYIPGAGGVGFGSPPFNQKPSENSAAHQIVTISPGERLDVTLPAFPTGVKSANIFVAVKEIFGTIDETYFTFMGTTTTSAGTIPVRAFIAPTLAQPDPVPTRDDPTYNLLISVLGADTPGGLLKKRDSGYYISLAWIIDPDPEGRVYAKLGQSELITLDEDNSTIRVTVPTLANPFPSPNGAKSCYVFIGTKPGSQHPMMFAGIVSVDDDTNTLDIQVLPTEINASSHALNLIDISLDETVSGTISIDPGSIAVTGVGTLFSTELEIGDRFDYFNDPAVIVISILSDTALTVSWPATAGSQGGGYDVSRNENKGEVFFSGGITPRDAAWKFRPSFLLSQDELGNVNQIQMSRTYRRIPFRFNRGTETGATGGDDLLLGPFAARDDFEGVRQNHNFIQKEAYDSDFPYKDPTFVFFQGLAYLVNGRDIPWQTDILSVGSLLEEYTTVLPPASGLISVFQESLVQLGSKQSSNKIFASNATDPSTWTIPATATNSVILRSVSIGDPSGGDPLTAFGKFAYTTGTDGPTSFVLAFKKSEVWRIGNLPTTGDLNPQLDQISGRVGCVASHTVVSTPAGTVFLGGDGEVYDLRGTGEPVPMGTKIKPILEHLSEGDVTANKATAVYHENFYKLSYPNALPSTLTGTISSNADSTQIDGVGTLFLTDLSVGDRIRVNERVLKVISITDDTTLDIDMPITSPDADPTSTNPLVANTLDLQFSGQTFQAYSFNNEQLWSDLRRGPNASLRWSGPHTGINVGSQIVLSSGNEDNTRIGAQSILNKSVTLDDTSTVQDLGVTVVSVLESKTYRYRREFLLKRFMRMQLDAFFDMAFTHTIVLQGFADDDLQTVTSNLSTGAAIWDSSNWNQANLGGARYFNVPLLYNDNALVGATYKYKITHSNPAQFIIAVIGTLFRPERRKIV